MKNRIKNFYKDLNDLPEMGDILDSQKNKSEPCGSGKVGIQQCNYATDRRRYLRPDGIGNI